MDVILSIKPQYVKRLVDGSKQFEFRKKVFKKPVERIYVYASAPTQKIVGYFEYHGYLADAPAEIWKQTHTVAGISSVNFESYFNNRCIAYALFVKQFVTINPIDPFQRWTNFSPPQSFRYIERGLIDL